MGISIVAALVLLACFWRAFYLKVRYPYMGRHRNGRVRVVWQTYHPTDSMNWDGLEPSQEAFGLWVARMGRDRRYPMLYMPIVELFEAQQQKLAEALSDYRWQHYDLDAWPKAWRMDEEKVAA